MLVYFQFDASFDVAVSVQEFTDTSVRWMRLSS